MALNANELTDSQKEFAIRVGDEAVRQGIDPDLAIAQAFQESRLHNFTKENKVTESNLNDLKSPHAYGIMQITPDTAKTLGLGAEDLKDPDKNIQAGVGLMKKYLDKYQDPAMALMAYHQGPGAVDKYLKNNDFNSFGPKGKDYVLKIGDNYDLENNTGYYNPNLPQKEEAPQREASMLGTVGHAIEKSLVPFAAMLPTAGAGAEALSVFGPVGTVVGGIGGGLLGGYLGEKGQEAALKAHPEVAEKLGLSEAQQRAEAEQYPMAQFAGTLLPNLAVMRPSGALLKSAEGLGERAAAALAAEKKAAVVNGAINSAITGGLETANEAGSGEELDPAKILMAGALGLAGQKETNIGRTMARIGEGPVAKITGGKAEALRRPPEAPPEVTPPPEPTTTVPPSGNQDIGAMLGELEGKPVELNPTVYGEPKPEATPEITPVEPVTTPETPPVVAAPEPIPVPEVKPIKVEEPAEPKKPFYSHMTYDELQALHNQAIEFNHALDIDAIKKHFGPEEAAKYEAMNSRQKEKWWDHNATEELEKDSSAFKGIDDEEIAAHLHAVNNFDIESAHHLGRSIAIKAKDFNKPEFVGSPEYTTVRNALQYAKDNGMNMDEVRAGMISRAEQWAGKEAPELFGSMFKAKEPTKVPEIPTFPELNYDKYHNDLINISAEKGIALGDIAQHWPNILDKHEVDISHGFNNLPPFAKMDVVKSLEVSKDGTVNIPKENLESIKTKIDNFENSSAQKEWTDLNIKPWDQLPYNVRTHLIDLRKLDGSLTPENTSFIIPHLEAKQAARNIKQENIAKEYENHLNEPRGEFTFGNNPYRIAGKIEHDFFTKAIKDHESVGPALDTTIKMLEEAPGTGNALDIFTPETNAWYLDLAKTFNKIEPVKKSKLFTPEYDVRRGQNKIGGTYFSYDNKVHMYPHAHGAQSLRTFLHEVTHAATVHELNKHVLVGKSRNGQWTHKALTPLGQDILKVYRAAKKSDPRGMYGNKNIREMFAEGFTSYEYTYHLMKQPSVLKSVPGTLWDDFKALVKRAVGIKGEKQLDKSLFDDLMGVSHDLVKGKTLENYKLERYGKYSSPTDTASESFGDVNYKGEKPPEATWQHPMTGLEPQSRFDEASRKIFTDKVLHALQDNQLDLKNIEKAIKAAGHTINHKFSAYEKEQTFHGRVATKIKEFLLDSVLPAVKEMEKNKVTPEELNTYLHNRHAEERNIQMNAINPDEYDPITGELVKENPLKDQGSGIHTKDAREYLANLDPSKKAALENVASHFDKMVQHTQHVLGRSGDVSHDVLDLWNETYKNYVPLHRIQEGESPFSGVGKGFAVRGNFGKRALGSKAEVDDIIGNIVAAHERALIREEKMRVQQAIYGLAVQHPQPGFWMAVNPDALKNPEGVIKELEKLGIERPEELIKNLMAEPKERYLKKVTAQTEQKDIEGRPIKVSKEVVQNKIDTMARYQDHVFTVRIGGKDRYVFFNPKDPYAMRMARSLQNMDAEQANAAMRGIGAATRWFANVNTQYNPVFGFVNLFRDVKGAMYNLSTTKLAGEQGKVAKGITPAMGGIINVLRDERKGITTTKGDWAELYKDFRREGGQAGHRESLMRRQDQQRIIQEKLSQIKNGNARRAFGYIGGALTDFNDMMENAVRLSAYKAALDKGMNKHEAAVLAKNLTVNFDKRGAFSQRVNSLYAFFNASVQGSARVLETLKGPAGKKIIAGGVGIGIMQSALLGAAGYDEEDIPEFVKEKNFIVPMPDNKYLSIPYPLGFNVFPNIGRITTDYTANGFDRTGKHLGYLASTIADAFNPLGMSPGMQMLAPTVLDPIVALGMNQDAFGRPISREDKATAPTPGWERSRDNASSISQGVAYGLNLLTSGGEEHAKGFISPTADQLDYLAGQVGGGVSRELLKAGEVAKSATTGEEVPTYRIPFVGRFVGDVGSQAATSQKFYQNITDMAEHENVVKGRMKDQGDVMGYYQDHPEARLWRAANNVENQINQINKRKRLLESKNASPDALKQIENQKAVIMERFNDQVKRSQEQ
jgi:hypothetical protein